MIHTLKRWLIIPPADLAIHPDPLDTGTPIQLRCLFPCQVRKVWTICAVMQWESWNPKEYDHGKQDSYLHDSCCGCCFTDSPLPPSFVPWIMYISYNVMYIYIHIIYIYIYICMTIHIHIHTLSIGQITRPEFGDAT